MTQEAIQITETPPLPGLKLVQDTNKALDTIATDFAGSADPAALAGPYMTWADTGNMLIKRRNAANTDWIVEAGLFVESQPKAANLSALAGITGANGELAVFTGDGSMAARPIVGTVSQSGGVPTGAIVESGSNAQGQYWRFAGGMQVCIGTYTPGAYLNFAAFFSSAPVGLTLVPEYAGDGNPSTTVNIRMSQIWSVLTSGFRAYSWSIGSGGSVASSGIGGRYTAIGRWYE